MAPLYPSYSPPGAAAHSSITTELDNQAFWQYLNPFQGEYNCVCVWLYWLLNSQEKCECVQVWEKERGQVLHVWPLMTFREEQF